MLKVVPGALTRKGVQNTRQRGPEGQGRKEDLSHSGCAVGNSLFGIRFIHQFLIGGIKWAGKAQRPTLWTSFSAKDIHVVVDP